jgi:hypothetical protein
MRTTILFFLALFSSQVSAQTLSLLSLENQNTEAPTLLMRLYNDSEDTIQVLNTFQAYNIYNASSNDKRQSLYPCGLEILIFQPDIDSNVYLQYERVPEKGGGHVRIITLPTKYSLLNVYEKRSDSYKSMEEIGNLVCNRFLSKVDKIKIQPNKEYLFSTKVSPSFLKKSFYRYYDNNKHSFTALPPGPLSLKLNVTLKDKLMVLKSGQLSYLDKDFLVSKDILIKID